eukprot:scaffold98190_cov29-Phaeocystis_antarctica.AAC.1
MQVPAFVLPIISFSLPLSRVLRERPVRFLTAAVARPFSNPSGRKMGRFFTSVAGKERKKARAAGAGGRPERDGEGLRRIRRIPCTFDQARTRASRRL